VAAGKEADAKLLNDILLTYNDAGKFLLKPLKGRAKFMNGSDVVARQRRGRIGHGLAGVPLMRGVLQNVVYDPLQAQGMNRAG
jgi:hypothetical protein